MRAATETSTSQPNQHFAGKAALVRAMVERSVEEVLKAQAPELDALEPMPALRLQERGDLALDGISAQRHPRC